MTTWSNMSSSMRCWLQTKQNALRPVLPDWRCRISADIVTESRAGQRQPLKAVWRQLRRSLTIIPKWERILQTLDIYHLRMVFRIISSRTSISIEKNRSSINLSQNAGWRFSYHLFSGAWYSSQAFSSLAKSQ